MWKLHGDRPRHLGDIAPQFATNKKTTAKHKPAWNYRSGWPNNDRLILATGILWARSTLSCYSGHQPARQRWLFRPHTATNPAALPPYTVYSCLCVSVCGRPCIGSCRPTLSVYRRQWSMSFVVSCFHSQHLYSRRVSTNLKSTTRSAERCRLQHPSSSCHTIQRTQLPRQPYFNR